MGDPNGHSSPGNTFVDSDMETSASIRKDGDDEWTPARRTRRGLKRIYYGDEENPKPKSKKQTQKPLEESETAPVELDDDGSIFCETDSAARALIPPSDAFTRYLDHFHRPFQPTIRDEEHPKHVGMFEAGPLRTISDKPVGRDFARNPPRFLTAYGPTVGPDYISSMGTFCQGSPPAVQKRVKAIIDKLSDHRTVSTIMKRLHEPPMQDWYVDTRDAVESTAVVLADAVGDIGWRSVAGRLVKLSEGPFAPHTRDIQPILDDNAKTLHRLIDHPRDEQALQHIQANFKTIVERFLKP